MEKQKSRKEILTEEINCITQSIEEARKLKKSCVKLRGKLVKLIIELDLLDNEQESKEFG